MRDENMSYTVKSSERLRKSGSEAETKALLYLMNFRPDSDDIYYFVVDFFNDLTGMDNMASRLWDVQSKGAHHVSPKAIGKELVTLFKNYMSPLTFEAYQLIVEHPDDSVQSLFTKIQAIPNCIARCPDFDALSLKYFISVVKDGVQQ